MASFAQKGNHRNDYQEAQSQTNKVARAVVGASLDDIQKKASQKAEFRTAQRDAALKEVKARKAANKAKSGRSSARPRGWTSSSKRCPSIWEEREFAEVLR